MAVNFDKLVLSPPIQQNIIDPVTREPTIGKIFFFKAGCLGCPKPIYHQSGDPQNPFVPATELDLDGAGALPFDIWFYPFNEDDETEAELYDIQVIATADNRLVLERLSWPPTTEFDPTPDEVGNNLNLCPNFEFHSMVNEAIYSIQPIKVKEVVFAWGTYTIAIENPAASDITYSSTLLNEGSATTIEQTPLNVVTFRATNTAGVSGFRRISFPLGHYNAFQGKFIYISHFLANISNTPTLTVKLQRTKGSDNIFDSTPINIGVLTIPSNNLEKVETTVTIPDITETGFNLDDRVYITLEPPENVDFQFSMTANWYQIVDAADAKGIVSRYPFGLSLANAFFNTGNLNCPTPVPSKIYSNNKNQACDGMAITQSAGFVQSIHRTGMVERVMSGSVHQANWGLLLSQSEDNLIYANEVPVDTGETVVKLAPSNRLISVLRDSAVNNKHAFSAHKKNSSSFEVSVLNSGTFKTDWVASNIASLTLTKNGTAFPFGLEAIKTSPTTMTLQYVNNFTVVNGFSNQYPFRDLEPGQQGFPIPPVANMGNWFGQDYTGGAGNAPPYGTGAITSTTIPAGGGKGVGLTLTYTTATLANYVAKFSKYAVTSGSNVTTFTRYHDFIEVPTVSSNIRAIPWGENTNTGGVVGVPTAGAFHIIYSVKTPSSQYLTGREKTLIIEIPPSVTTREELIDLTVNKLSGTESYTVQVNTLPTHGDFVTFSNDIFDYAVVFVQKGQGTPNIPAGNFERTFFLEFPSGETIDSFNNKFIIFFDFLLRALPSLSELSLPNDTHSSFMINL